MRGTDWALRAVMVETMKRMRIGERLISINSSGMHGRVQHACLAERNLVNKNGLGRARISGLTTDALCCFMLFGWTDVWKRKPVHRALVAHSGEVTLTPDEAWRLASQEHSCVVGTSRVGDWRAIIKRSVWRRQSERYRSGRNGGASKASCRVTGTWVRIPPSPPYLTDN